MTSGNFPTITDFDSATAFVVVGVEVSTSSGVGIYEGLDGAAAVDQAFDTYAIENAPDQHETPRRCWCNLPRKISKVRPCDAFDVEQHVVVTDVVKKVESMRSRLCITIVRSNGIGLVVLGKCKKKVFQKLVIGNIR